MTMINEKFSVGDRCEVVVGMTSADVSIVEGGSGSIEVEADGQERALELVEVYQEGDTVTVRSLKGDRRWSFRRLTVRITAPAGVAVRGRTSSGDLRISAPVSDVEIDSASGDVRIAALDGNGRIKTASGDVTIGRSIGGLRVASASGDVRVEGFEGDMSIGTASGDVATGDVSGSIGFRTVSGDVVVREFGGGRLDASSMSGDFRVWLARGMTVDTDIQTISGTFLNRIKPSDEQRTVSAALSIKTLSGDITLN